MAINNNQIFTLVRGAYVDALGGASLENLKIEDLSDFGDLLGNILENRDQFTKALIMQCAKNWFTDTSYRTMYNDPFFEDEREYGAIIQMISATAPEVQESHAWQNFVSGTSKVGEYTVFIPLVESKLFGKTVSWEINISLTDEQWDDAVRNAEELGNFTAYIMMVVDNAIVCHLENMNSTNRNNFIVEKEKAEADANVAGVHVINLIEAYNTERGGSITTVADFLKSPEAMRFGACKIDEYVKYFGKMSKLFNTEGKARFTPDERKVVQVVKKFASAMAEVNYATTFNAGYTQLPNYEEVPFWQGFGSGASWDDVTTIKTVEGTGDSATEKTYTGIVALIADKWAIMHTIRKHRVAVHRADPEALTTYFYQYRDSYMNNLGMNGLVFVLEDIT